MDTLLSGGSGLHTKFPKEDDYFSPRTRLLLLSLLSAFLFFPFNRTLLFTLVSAR